jgi:hypothetical protein
MAMEMKSAEIFQEFVLPQYKTIAKAETVAIVNTVNHDENIDLYAPSLILAIFSGLVSAVLGGFIWAEMNIFVEMHHAAFAIFAGILVGMFVRFFGRGDHKKFGFVAVAFALVSCVIGSILNVVSFLALHLDLGYLEVLITLDYTFLLDILTEGFTYPDFFVYFVMCLLTYKISFTSERDFSDFQKFFPVNFAKEYSK